MPEEGLSWVSFLKNHDRSQNRWTWHPGVPVPDFLEVAASWCPGLEVASLVLGGPGLPTRESSVCELGPGGFWASGASIRAPGGAATQQAFAPRPVRVAAGVLGDSVGHEPQGELQ